MIPLQLQLKNFLSYGPSPQKINFSPYHLVCLSGKNGHGKSALLDAITWALWGQARKTTLTSKADSGLLRLGQTHMCVILDFECNNNRYRVRREYSYSLNKPHAALDFGVWCSSTNRYIPLTDKTIRKTQEVIEKTIKLTYEAFVNSAFLKQGEANEFSKKSPKERKDILSHILGIHHFDLIRARALEKIKNATAHKNSLIAIREKLQNEIAQLASGNNQLEMIEEQLSQLISHETSINTQLHLLQSENTILIEKKQKAAMLQFGINQHISGINERINRLTEARILWRQTHTTHLQIKKSIEEISITQLDEKINALTAQHHSYNFYKEQIIILKEALHAQYTAVENEGRIQLEQARINYEQAVLHHTHVQEKYASAQEEVLFHKEALTKIQQQIIQLNQELEVTLRITNNKEHALQQFEKRKEYYQKFIAEGTCTKKELDALVQKIEMVNDDYCPSCPLCEQNLSASRKRFLKSKFNVQEHVLVKKVARLYKITTQLKCVLKDQHEQITRMYEEETGTVQKLTRLEELRQQEQIIHQKLNDSASKVSSYTNLLYIAQQEIARTSALVEQLQNTIQTQLTANTQIQSLQTQIQEYEMASQTIAPDEKLLKKLIEQRHFLSSSSSNAQLIQQEERKSLISHLCLEIRNAKKERQVLENQLSLYQDLEQLECNLTTRFQELQNQLKQLINDREQLIKKRINIEHQIAQHSKYIYELEITEKQIKEIDILLGDLQIISSALSKDGIQALLIEEVIPEIEHYANELLAKLTDNQAQIIIESLRDLKRGGTKETLDIKVSDAMGVRPYELFSGGEAFRIDFSLRVAISKLLAQRAGTTLQTLIIDEGFGSQDEEGLSRVMDAIYKVQNDFSKIIIVSHLPSMKEQFPIHFVISKDSLGSTVTVVENG